MTRYTIAARMLNGEPRVYRMVTDAHLEDVRHWAEEDVGPGAQVILIGIDCQSLEPQPKAAA